MAARILFQALLPRSTMATATFFSADIASQLLTTTNESALPTLASFSSEWDPSRSMKTAAFGLGVVGWYGFSTSFLVARVFPASAKGVTFATAMLQAATQQALFAPPLTFSFLYASAALVHDDESAFETAKDQLPEVGALAWTFLPWANGLANWAIRNPTWKAAALNGIAFGWATYLATVATPRDE
ncbi:hypothetical protein HDU77_010465 [Chytriomyces hyalinus]|nr:hypothetical protein HDU77_010465 [Chytriomyces hyalinus]